ncbi:hypothetical protein MASR1M90_12900 [Desulfovibrionales bacterium]
MLLSCITRVLKLPLFASSVVFCLLFAVSYGYWSVFTENIHLNRLHALDDRLNLQANVITQALFQAEAPLFALATMVEVHQGHIDDFELHATALLKENPIASAMMLAPDAVVTRAYPLAGNEAAIGHDLLNDPQRKTEVHQAIATKTTSLAGPVNMRQGGTGFFMRRPVFFLKDGQEQFWGLVVAKLRWEDLIAAFHFEDLTAQGYAYCLSRKLDTDPEPVTILRSDQENIEKYQVHKILPIPGGYWRLDLSFASEYDEFWERTLGLSLGIAFLVAFLVFQVLHSKKHLARQNTALATANTQLEQEIANRIKTEADLRQAKEATEQAMQAKADFLALMSHEIRTPMNGVYGMLQLLGMTDVNEEQKNYVDTGMMALKSSLNLINDVLDLSKINADKLDIVVTDFETSRLYRSIPNIFRAQTLAKHTRLNLEIDPAMPQMLHGDPNRIQQILFNLVGNAVKFTNQGEVTVHLAVESSQTDPSLRTLLLTVADTGVGIPEDQLGTIFQPYMQARTNNHAEPGTGLGLSIVKQLIDRMDGTVDIQSAPGQGTTIRVTLPLRMPIS